MRWDWHPYLHPDRVEHDHAAAARLDPRGHRLHLAFAILWCFASTFPTSVLEFAGLPLIIIFVLRFPKIWRAMGSALVQPAMLALLALIAWQALSLTWSPDQRQGADEIARWRWIWATWMLWPVIIHRRLLIAALAAGFLVGNLVQLAHGVGLRLGIDWLTFNRFPDRNSGWWDPVAGGSILVAALGLHLPAALRAPGRTRVLAALCVLITLAAILATGTRGAWIAAAALLLIAVAIAILAPGPRPTTRAKRLRTMLIAGAIGLALTAALWATQHHRLASRLDAARQDLRAAAQGNYATDTGARLLMARMALLALREHPIAGVGAGGYRAWSIAALRDPNAPIHDHAHNAALHIAATTGVVGLALLTITALAAVIGGCSPRAGSATTVPWGGYPSGPGLAILGLLIVSAFDVVHLNTQTAAVLMTLLPMCFIARPRERDLADALTAPATR